MSWMRTSQNDEVLRWCKYETTDPVCGISIFFLLLSVKLARPLSVIISFYPQEMETLAPSFCQSAWSTVSHWGFKVTEHRKIQRCSYNIPCKYRMINATSCNFVAWTSSIVLAAKETIASTIAGQLRSIYKWNEPLRIKFTTFQKIVWPLWRRKRNSSDEH